MEQSFIPGVSAYIILYYIVIIRFYSLFYSIIYYIILYYVDPLSLILGCNHSQVLPTFVSLAVW